MWVNYHQRSQRNLNRPKAKARNATVYQSFNFSKQVGRYRTGGSSVHEDWSSDARRTKKWDHNEKSPRKSLRKAGIPENIINWDGKKGAKIQKEYGSGGKRNQHHLDTSEVRRYQRYRNRERDFGSQISTLYGNYGNFEKKKRQLHEQGLTHEPRTISVQNQLQNSTFYFQPKLQKDVKEVPTSHVSMTKGVELYGVQSKRR